MKRWNSDERLRRLERQARAGGPRTPWLAELLRHGHLALEEIQFQARSLDPETVRFYASVLESRGLLGHMKEHFEREATREYNGARQALVETRQVTILHPSGDKTMIASAPDQTIFVTVGGRQQAPNDQRNQHWSPDLMLTSMWPVSLVDPNSGVERHVERELAATGGDLVIEAPAISISGRVTWPDWRFSGEIAEAAALDHYKQMRGKLLLAEQVSGYSMGDNGHWHFDPPRLVRVAQTSLSSVRHWGDEGWLDPYWDIELPTVPPTHEIRLPDPDVAWTENGSTTGEILRSLWIDAPSYMVDNSGERQEVSLDQTSIHFTVVPEPD